MSPETKPLAGLIASLADGWPLDWAALERSAGDEATRSRVRDLRAIAALAAFRRSSSATTDRCEDDLAYSTLDDTLRRPEAPLSGGIGQKCWGRFRLRCLLGEGAYGEVYSALDTQLDRVVALKLLKPCRSSSERRQRMLDEARMLAQVRHPNVASVYGADEHDGRAGFWMELIDGVNLEEMVRVRGPLSALEATLVGQDLCRALSAVHGAGLVHADVKTANVLRERGGRIVLTDLGASCARGFASAGPARGTPLYLAPEVRHGRRASPLSDIYSLGVVLFRLVTAAYPCKVVSVGGVFETCGAPLSLRDVRPELPDSFISVVEQALAPEPRERPRSAGTLRAALGGVLGVAASS